MGGTDLTKFGRKVGTPWLLPAGLGWAGSSEDTPLPLLLSAGVSLHTPGGFPKTALSFVVQGPSFCSCGEGLRKPLDKNRETGSLHQ